MSDTTQDRDRMVATQIQARGVSDEATLRAMRDVPRERFLPERLREFAYVDSPLPIGEEQTISQPYIVALMCAALELRPGARVLEIGTGSGYAAGVLSRMAREVYTIERHASLAAEATERLAALGYANVHVKHGDGSLGWPDAAPFDAITVAAGGPSLPRPLLAQLAIGGKLVIPVGSSERLQELVRVTRVSEDRFEQESLGGVRFVPLIGAHGWAEPGAQPSPPATGRGVPHLIAECAEPIDRVQSVDLAPLLDRIGDARVVLLGEATHGTAEFYRMRTRITQELVLRRGFRAVAVEADWPDAAQVDRYALDLPRRERAWTPFARFPQWMWRNEQVVELVEWLRAYNAEHPVDKVRFRGLDLYSMYTSIAEVLAYLDRVDPPTAAVARERYGGLTPWASDPAVYGRAVLTGQYRSCEGEVTELLRALLEKRLELAARDGDDFFDAVNNARLVRGAEAYYRVMYYGGAASWNLRDQHMFETLEVLLARAGESSKIVVWEHNSHIGNAEATEMSARGELNVGALARARFGDAAYAVGFGTDRGIVAAASAWDGPLEEKRIRPSHESSYERLCHDSGRPAFLLPLRTPRRDSLRDELMPPRLERAIGVIYKPETEMVSHYFEAILPEQFDEYVWFDETGAVTPLAPAVPRGAPETYPFGL